MGRARIGSKPGYGFAQPRNERHKIVFSTIPGLCSNSGFLAPSNGKAPSLNHRLEPRLLPFYFYSKITGITRSQARYTACQEGPGECAEQMSGLLPGQERLPGARPRTQDCCFTYGNARAELISADIWALFVNLRHILLG